MSDNIPVLMETDLPLPLFIKGKVRDTYDLGDNLLIVATDRISAFDVILPNGIPNKGRVLNQLSAFWFHRTASLVPNHLVASVEEIGQLEAYFPTTRPLPQLVGRSMIVRKYQRLSVECVVRGYLSGSAWEEYRKNGTISGQPAPKGLLESQELPGPMFTPTTKAEAGHDLPMSLAEVEEVVGKSLAEELKKTSLAVYDFAQGYARDRGVIVADTKMEFGLDGDRLILIDELLTPDSSRFWDIRQYRVGQPQPSYDKQIVRDWLNASGWNREPPPPALPPEVITRTAARYEEVYQQLTGRKLAKD